MESKIKFYSFLIGIFSFQTVFMGTNSTQGKDLGQLREEYNNIKTEIMTLKPPYGYCRDPERLEILETRKRIVCDKAVQLGKLITIGRVIFLDKQFQ
jgi:hypothetical protein